jgi:DNA-binding NarL/FixJ family response regulator
LASRLAAAGALVRVAANADAARRLLADGLCPDAAVLQLGLRGRALPLHAELGAARRPCATVMLAAGRPATFRRLLAAGVLEPLEPSASREEMLQAVARALDATARWRRGLGDLEGRLPAPVRLHATLDEALGRVARHRGLSAREHTVLRYLALGYRYADIGRRLRIAPRTVKMHAASVRRKAGVRSRHELLREVFEP